MAGKALTRTPQDVRADTVERAYALARSGQFNTLEQVIDRLEAEGYGTVQTDLRSRIFRRELRDLCAERGG